VPDQQITVYVYLPDEAVDVWRPVKGTVLGPDIVRIDDIVPEDEIWEFLPGEIVRVRERRLSDGVHLVAIEAIED